MEHYCAIFFFFFFFLNKGGASKIYLLGLRETNTKFDDGMHFVNFYCFKKKFKGINSV